MTTQANIDKLFNEAIRHHQNKDFDSALALYNKIIDIDPKCTDAWVNKGNILGQQGSFDSALTCYQRALGLATRRKEVIFRSMGMIEHLRGNFDRSISLHRQALQENRRCGLSWLGLVQVLISARRGKEAKEECGKFMLNCTVEDGPLYFKAKRLVDQFVQYGKTGDPAEHNEIWYK